MAIVTLPTALRRFTDGETECDLKGENLSIIVQQLINRYPKLKPFFESEQSSHYITWSLNEKLIINQDPKEIFIAQNDTITLIPAVAGG